MTFRTAVCQVLLQKPAETGPLPPGMSAAGAAFLVAPDLAVTCAHVLGGAPPEGPVWLRAAQVPGKPVAEARLVEGTWRSPDGDVDVAVLRLANPLSGIQPLRLRAVTPRGLRLESFGFPAQALLDGHAGEGRIQAVIDHAGRAVVQLNDANSLAQGFSGAPLVDERGQVVAMVTGHPGRNDYGRGTALAYATPASVLRGIVPGPLDVAELCPYPGLDPLTAEQQDWFFGRENLRTDLEARLEGGQPVVMLLGPSGSGKTSLVGAGLARWGDTGGPPVVLRPSLDADALAERVRRHRDGLLVIDQFEEALAVLDGDSGADRLAGRQMRALLEAIVDFRAPHARLLLVMRNDFYPQLDRHAPHLLKQLESGGLVNVPSSLTKGELAEIIVRPAATQGWTVGDDLQASLIATLTEGHARPAAVTDLPVLALALRRTWEVAARAALEAAPDGAVLTLRHYDRTGGLNDVFAMECDDAFNELPAPPAPHQAVARGVLTNLVHDHGTGDGVPVTRQPRRVGELRSLSRTGATTTSGAQDVFDDVLHHLARRRVITTHAVQDQDEPREAFVELTHDSLITRWPQLQQWLTQNRADRARVEDLHRRAQAWEASRAEGGRRDRHLLISGTALKEARTRVDLPEGVRRLVDASTRHARRVRTVLAVGTTFVLALAAFAGVQWFLAVQRQQDLVAGALAAQSVALHELDPSSSSLFALAALDHADTSGTREAVQMALRGDVEQPLQLTGHTDEIEAVEVSPDGRTVATASQDDTVRLWDMTSGELLRTLTGHRGDVTTLDFDPEGRRLATGDLAGDVNVWDGADGRLLHTLTPPGGGITHLAFSPDGTQLAAADSDGFVRLYSGTAGERVRDLRGHDDWISALDYSPDGRSLVTASWDGTARTWDTATGRPLHVLAAHTGRVNDVAFSVDGRTLVTGGNDSTARLWQAATARPLRTLTGHSGAVAAVAYLPDGRTLVTGSDDGTARLWAAADGAALRTFRGLDGPVREVTLSRDGTRLAAAGSNPRAVVWDTATGQTVRVLSGHTTNLTEIDFSPNGSLLIASGLDGTAWVWTTTGGDSSRQLVGHTGTVTAVAVSPDGRLLASGSDDSTARLWAADSGRPIHALTGHVGPLTGVSFAPDGQTLATSGTDDTVRLWDTRTGAASHVLGTATGRAGVETTMAFSPDGSTLAASGDENTVYVWDTTTGDLLHTLSGHDGSVWDLAFSPDRRTLATAGDDNTVRLWDAAEGVLLHVLTGHYKPTTDEPTGGLTSVTFSPDGASVAAASLDGNAQVWNTMSGEPRHTLFGHSGEVTDVMFTSDGHTLATASTDGTARTWDLITGETRHTLVGHRDAVTAVVFGPDDATIATAGADGTARVWDATSGALRHLLPGHTDGLTAAVFLPDGQRLLTGSRDGTARVFRLEHFSDNPLCQRAGRNMTSYEWSTYFGSTPYRRHCAAYPSDDHLQPDAPVIPARPY